MPRAAPDRGALTIIKAQTSTATWGPSCVARDTRPNLHLSWALSMTPTAVLGRGTPDGAAQRRLDVLRPAPDADGRLQQVAHQQIKRPDALLAGLRRWRGRHHLSPPPIL